jgi:hypothetical protein
VAQGSGEEVVEYNLRLKEHRWRALSWIMMAVGKDECATVNAFPTQALPPESTAMGIATPMTSEDFDM